MADMQTSCILITSNYVICPQILIFLVFKIASFSWYWLQIKFLSKSWPRRWIPCWLLTNTALTSDVTNFRCHKLIAKVNKYNNSELKNVICDHYEERLARSEAIKSAICLHFLPYLPNSCRKFEFLIYQGCVATCLRWGGQCHMGFVANFIRFPAVQVF